jgi:hypothetical protein
MTIDYPLDQAPATPEYVLEVFRALHQMALAAGEADRLSISFDTRIRDWEESLWIDTWGHGGFGAAMNAQWGTDISLAEWKAFRYADRNLGDLCRLISSRATRPMIRPWKHVAGNCLPAGAFLTLRAALAEAGVDPKLLTPSSPLEPFLTRRYDSLWIQLNRLAPGCSPLPAHTSFGRLLEKGIAMCTLLSLPALFLLPIVGVPLLVVSAVGLFLTTRYLGYWKFSDPDIHTFRDLAYCLAGQQPRRQIQPSA